MVVGAFKVFYNFAVPSRAFDVSRIRFVFPVLKKISHCIVTIVFFFRKDSVVMPFFPYACRVPVVVVVFLKSLVAVEVPTFPVAHGVVVLVVSHGLLAAGVQPFYEVACPRPFALAVFVFAVERHVAEHCPALDTAMRYAILVLDFEFLDAVVVPLVALEDFAVGVHPHGSFLCAVHVFFDNLLLGMLDGAAAKTATDAQKRQKGQKCRKNLPAHVHQSRKKVIS